MDRDEKMVKKKSTKKNASKKSKVVRSVAVKPATTKKEEKSMAGNTGLDQNVAGALCYVLGLITGIIFLVIEPNNKYIKFHAMQSILWSVGIWILFMILGMIGILTFGIGFLILAPLMMIIQLIAVLSWLWLMYQAYSGNKWQFPIVGGIADNMSK